MPLCGALRAASKRKWLLVFLVCAAYEIICDQKVYRTSDFIFRRLRVLERVLTDSELLLKTTSPNTSRNLITNPSSGHIDFNGSSINKKIVPWAVATLRRRHPPFRRPLTISGNYIINNVTICSDVNEVTVLVVVHSAVNHYERRHYIRSTYGARDLFRPAEVRVIFLLGLPTISRPKFEQYLILEESKLYSDIIQGDFLDTYHNLTEKAVMGLRWVSENCRNAKYILKVDDDAMFDMWKFVTRFPGTERSKTVWCSVFNKAAIQRRGKWTVPSHQFPGLRVYPFRYCAGFVVIMTADIVPELFRMARLSPYFWIDDVYVYGILLSRIPNSTLLRMPVNFSIIVSPNASLLCLSKPRCRGSVLAVGVKTKLYRHVWSLLRQKNHG